MKLGKTMGKHHMFSLLLMVLLLLLSCTVSAWADDTIKIIVNGSEVNADAVPYLKNDRTMVPIRFITEPLGAVLSWQPGENGAGGKASLTLDGKTVDLVIGSKEGMVNGQVVVMDVAAEIVQGRTFVPLRFAGENLGATVNWDGAAKEVTVIYQKPTTDVALSSKKIMGFYYDYYSLDDITGDAADFSDVIHFGYLLKADGTVREKDNFAGDKFAAEGKQLAERKGMKTQMLVTAFDRTISDAVLGDEALRTNTINSIVQFVKEEDFDGVNLDYEVVSVSMRDNFTAFVRDLKAALPRDVVLSLSLRCRTYDSQTWLDGYDYAGLAKYADQCIVMMYDQHYNGGEAGPIAGIDWMETSIKYLSQYIPKEKFIVGIGAYGRYWPENGKGSAIFIQPAFDLAKEQGVEVLCDEASGVPHFDYESPDKGKVSVWFEDAVSIGQKMDLVKKYDLAGVAVWRMGRVPSDVWAAINSLTK
ncbi:MAG: hypothetical protein HFI72_01740 [Peptococcaceae bacterium]|nr:hypothetical protein [Peptococcaceae bacterium]